MTTFKDGIGPENMRHLWLDAKLRVDSMLADHFRLMREADSMRLDTRLRRWRGVLVNRATHLPSSEASIFMSTVLDTVPRRVEFVRSDEFELIDQPIGGALLVIQCPGSRPHQAEPLAVVNVQIGLLRTPPSS